MRETSSFVFVVLWLLHSSLLLFSCSAARVPLAGNHTVEQLKSKDHFEKDTSSYFSVNSSRHKERNSSNNTRGRLSTDPPPLNLREHVRLLLYCHAFMNRAEAYVDVWKPLVAKGFVSRSLIRLQDTAGRTIEAGWEVSPTAHPDGLPRFYVDNYDITGQCDEGTSACTFQPARNGPLGTIINPQSVYGNGHKNYERLIHIAKNKNGDWELHVTDSRYSPMMVGFWPSKILVDANYAQFGGEMLSIGKPRGHHSSRIQMGSGDFARQGYSKSSYLRNVDVGGVVMNDQPSISNSACYSYMRGPPKTDWGRFFYYGGPGCRL